MAIALKGEAPLKLSDDREFTLVLDMEALIEAEAAYGKPLEQMMGDAARGFVGASRALLYGALRARHPSITLRDAATMFMSDLEAVTDALGKASEAGFPKASAEGNAAAPAQAGKPSGSNGAKPGSNRKRSGAKPRARSS